MTIQDVRNYGYKLSANVSERTFNRFNNLAESYIQNLLVGYKDTEYYEEFCNLCLDTSMCAAIIYIGIAGDDVYATTTGGERKRNDYGYTEGNLWQVKSETVAQLKNFLATVAAMLGLEIKPLDTSFDPLGLFFKAQFFY